MMAVAVWSWDASCVHCALCVMAVAVWSWDASCVHCALCTVCIPAPHSHSHHYQCRTPYAAVHTIVLLIMGIMMLETCWDSLIINIRLVASCWFLSLHPKVIRYLICLLKAIQSCTIWRKKACPLFTADVDDDNDDSSWQFASFGAKLKKWQCVIYIWISLGFQIPLISTGIHKTHKEGSCFILRN